ncbi:MAG: Membrane protein [Candidatus Berkelbacteria bacterium]|nr:Membrane protein [Candidatus Berkelbacteria bacterium]
MRYLIFIILLLLPTYLIRFSVFNIPSTLLEILIYIIFIMGIYRATRIGFKKPPWQMWAPISLLVISLLISTIISPDKRTALGEFKGFFLDPLIVVWLIWQFIKKEDIQKLFLALIGSGLFVSVHTIIQRILGHTTSDGRAIGIFGYSPNYVALFLAPISVMAISLGTWFIIKKQYRMSALLFLVSIINLSAIYFSGSRGGFLAVLAGLGIYFICQFWGWIRYRISAKIMILILLLVGFYVAWTFFRPDLSATPDAGRVATSNNVRWQIWSATLELGAKHPILGVGLGNFQNAFGEFTKTRANFPEFITPFALTPHNIFFMFWLSSGISGLIGLFWVIVSFLKESVKKISEPSAPILIAVFSSIILYGLVEASIWKNDLSIIFWTIWGLIWLL